MNIRGQLEDKNRWLCDYGQERILPKIDGTVWYKNMGVNDMRHGYV